ncbi:MAG: WD40 repeat domain-containing protein [Cuspidothrix sp.]
MNQSPAEINEFFSFIAECLKIVYVKIIFSLREDYIYLLLRGTRHFNLDAINNDILNKDILYYLGNLSVQVTTDLITNLTHRSDFNLEPELITELVRDLTTELGDIRPIELQIIGSQLQTESITTLTQYNQLGSGKARKEKLVNNYLAVVINACGEENIEVARFVLSLLINEKDNTRPLKTKLEIAESLTILKIGQEEQKLDLVLQIFVLSGLVMLLPEKPLERYQLVHDYLVEVIRQQMDQSLLTRLQQAELERDKLLADLKLALHKARNQEIIALSNSANAYYALNPHSLDSLLEALKAAKQLQQNLRETPLETQQFTKIMLRRSLDDSPSDIRNFKEKNRLSGHQSAVRSVAFSPDGQTIASASADKTIKLWSQQGKLLQTLSGHQGVVWSVAFSPDGQTIASSSFDRTIKLWSKEGKLLQTLSGHPDWVNSVAFSPDGQTIASASADNTIKLWSQQGKLLQTLSGHQEWVYSVAFSPDGQTIASASGDKTIKLWNLSLDDMVNQGCAWLGDYLRNSADVSEGDKHLCD